MRRRAGRVHSPARLIFRLALWTLLLVVAITSLTVAAALSELPAIRRLAEVPVDELSAKQLRDAADALGDVASLLEAPAPSALRRLPVVGDNLDLVRVASASGGGVLRHAAQLLPRLEELETSLLEDGVIDYAGVAELAAPLERQAVLVEEMHAAMSRTKTDSVVPALREKLDPLIDQAPDPVHLDAAAELARSAPELAGAEEPQTYLILLINNAELRGAGGILSSLGTLQVSDGRVDLGRFYYYAQIARGPPFEPVDAPPEFVRRFARYDAHTTRIVSVTSSPDVPDVATVAARLFEKLVGPAPAGVFVVDPRGAAALLAPDQRIRLPGNRTLRASELADYSYSGVYADLGGGSSTRRRAQLALGRSAFEIFLKTGLVGQARERVAHAVAGGHIRFVHFDPGVGDVLSTLGVVGDLPRRPHDAALVTVQNYGGTKLDYWVQRKVGHSCLVDDDGVSRCSTEVIFTNDAPVELPPYVYQYRPIGLNKSFVEIYVPASADVLSFDRDGRPLRHRVERENGLRSLGTYLELPRDSSTHLRVAYSLPAAGDTYHLDLIPQPLSRDAGLTLELSLPAGWEVSPSDIWERGSSGYVRAVMPFDRPLQISAHPSLGDADSIVVRLSEWIQRLLR